MCHICCGQCIPIVEYSKGSMILTLSTCENGHIDKWQSQSSHKKLPWFNLHLACEIVFTGNIMSKALMFFDQLKVLVPSARSILRLVVFQLLLKCILHNRLTCLNPYEVF